MNQLSNEKREQIVAALVEGCSIRSTVRMTGASKNTIAKLLVELGAACSEYMDKAMRNLPCKRLQADEIWSFIGAKQKNVTPKNAARGAIGDIWTWVAIDAETKLVPCWYIGDRGGESATEFISDLASRLKNRVQLTTDGLKVYVEAVESAFWKGIDYAMLVKIYGADRSKEATYSPADCIGCRPVPVLGVPNPKHISTSFVERQNLTMRMSMRRFTRLTNAFSKKIENHVASISIHYTHYNFCRIHQTLRVTPAMEAGLADHVWSIQEMLSLLP